MKTLFQDFRYGLRILAAKPGFTAIAVLTLAMGIGANTAIFSVVNAVLIQPLPYENPQSLVAVLERFPRKETDTGLFSAPDFEDLEQQTQTVETMAAYQNKDFELSGIDRPERITGARVSAALFPLLGVQPAMGRTFTAQEDREGRLLVVLSNGIWRRQFGSDPEIIGRKITLDRRPYEVTAVMPRTFEFPQRGQVSNNQPADLWVPISFTDVEKRSRAGGYNKSVVARLRPGTSVAESNAELRTIADRIHEQYPPELRNNPAWALSAEVKPLSEEVAGRARTALLILMGAVAFVMLIGCADVASLLLTHAAARQREMAIRAALGASRIRLARQALTESLLLAFCGGFLGALLAGWGVGLLRQIAPESIPRIEEIGIDLRVLGFTFALAVATALVFGLAPALEAVRGETSEALKEGGRGATSGRRRRLILNGLVIVQFAMSLVLLIGAGLLVRSFARLTSTDPGFRPEQVLSLSINLPGNRYEKADQVRSFYERLIERVKTLPGVRATGAANELPMAVRERRIFTSETAMGDTSWTSPSVANVYVMGDYHQGLGVPLKSGRYFTSQDGQAGDPVVLISEMMVRLHWPGADPVGKRIKWGTPDSRGAWMTVVGVVGDVKQGSLDTEAVPQVYEPYRQIPDSWIERDYSGWLRAVKVVVRTEGDPMNLAEAVRSEVAGMDRSLPISDIRTMEERIERSVSPQRFNLFVLTVFATVAMAFAAPGIYGVIAYSVAQRTHEIGIRMALGARRLDVLGLVLRHGLSLALIGLALGLLGALVLTRLMSSLLYAVSSSDPLTFVLVAFLFTGVALAGCYIPARRATRVDPMEALRYE